jgi:hypothetical protein
VSIKKISNKTLSRNLKIRKAPLRVLPMATFHIRRRVKKQKMMEKKRMSLHPPTIRHVVKEVIRTKGKIREIAGRKGPIKVQPFKNLHFTNALQWILLLIFIYFAAGAVIIMIQEGTELLKNIVVYSIIGFFTFFMGCIGWILARDVFEIVAGKKNVQNEA